MKTTIAVLWIGKQTAVAANVGDSRIYQFRDGKIIYQSVDHSVGQMAVLVGEIQPDQIRQYPKRSQLACNLRSADKKSGQQICLLTESLWK